MPNNDTVQIQIQPVVEEIDTSKLNVAKSFKARFADLQNEFYKVFSEVAKSGEMAKPVESALNKAATAQNKATTAIEKQVKAREELVRATERQAELEQTLGKKENLKTQLQNFRATIPEGVEQMYRNQVREIESFGGLKQFIKSNYADGKGGYNLIAAGNVERAYNEAKRYLTVVDTLTSQIGQLTDAEEGLNRATLKQDGAAVNAELALTKFCIAVKNLQTEMDRASGATDGSVDGMSRLDKVSAITSTVLIGLGRTAKATFSTMKKVVQRVAHAVVALASKLSSLFKNVGKQSKGLEFNHKKLFKTFLQFGLGVRSLYFLIRRMRTELIKGMKQLAAAFPEVNAQVSALTMAFNQLKGSAVTMVQPILATVIPALVRLMNVLSEAMVTIAKFFAVLRGQKVIYKAASANVDYSKSIDGVGDSAKEANQELAEYDNLLVIPQDNAGKGSGGNGSGDENPYTFTEEPVNAMSDFAKRLKAAWEAGDWEGVGEVIADKLNGIIAKVDKWITKKFAPAAKMWASRIARILNGFIGKFNWKKLGKTAANGINAVFDAIETFLDKFKSKTLGKKLGDLIKSFFDSVNWRRIGRVFAKKWNTLMNIIKGIVTKKGIWESIGKAIVDFITSWFTTIDLDSLATIIIGLFNGVTTTIKTFLDKNPFKEIGVKLAKSIKRIITEIDWEEFIKTLSQFFVELLKALEEVDWDTAGRTIGAALGNIDWIGIFGRVAIIIAKAAIGAIKGLLSSKTGKIFLALVAGLNTLKIAFKIAAPILKVVAANLAETVLSKLSTLPGKIVAIGKKAGVAAKGLLGKQITSGVGVAGVAGSAVAGVGAGAAGTYLGLQAADLIQPGSKQEFIDAFNDTYSADSLGGNLKIWAKEWGNIFSNLWKDIMPSKQQWENAKTNISNWAQGVGKKLSGVWDNVKRNVANLKEKIVVTWENIKEKVVGFVKGIWEKVTGIWTKIKDTVSGIVKRLGEKISSIWKGIKDGVVGFVNGIKDGLEKIWDKIKTTAETVFQNLSDSLRKIWEGIYNFIRTPINAIISGVEWLANAVVDAVNWIIDALNSIHFEIPEWLANLAGVKGAAGKEFGFNITKLEKVRIGRLPELAQGAVIPPNREFLAVLGDQSRGTNIEAPLDTIKQALAEVMSELGAGNRMPEKIQVVLPNGKVLAETVWKEEKKYYKQTGQRSPAY